MLKCEWPCHNEPQDAIHVDERNSSNNSNVINMMPRPIVCPWLDPVESSGGRKAPRWYIIHRCLLGEIWKSLTLSDRIDMLALN